MLSKRLKEIRNSRKITQTEMAKAINVTQGTIANWETGKRKPDLDMLSTIAQYFRVPLCELTDTPVEIAKSAEISAVIPSNKIYQIPVFGTVSAGFGALAENEIIEYIPVAIKNSYDVKDTIGILVRGDSMYPKIEDGDIIVVRKQDSVDNGDVAVMLLDGEEGLVKKVTYGKTWIELQSFNPEYKTRRFDGAEVQRLRVVGKVTTIIKKL